ncbi:MAG: hypothetical protein ACRD8Z_02170 [Nitrososphaeraceae archaeon]
MFDDKSFIYTVIPLTGLLLVASTMTPSLVLAERIPFAIQNVTQSTPSELVEGMFQVANLLPLRDDGKFYVGQLTYTSSAPVEVNVLQPTAANVSGPQPVSVPGLNGSITALDFDEPKHFNSVAFTGSEIVLLYRSSEPFSASYSVVGEAVDPEPLTN